MSIAGSGPLSDSTPGVRVLIVEDSKAGLQALGRLLNAQGYEVTQAMDGHSATEALASKGPFDVVLVDLMLPDGDGREICRMARDQFTPPPITALITGWTVEPDDAEFERWGIDHLFLKPFEIQDLLTRLRSALEDRERAP